MKNKAEDIGKRETQKEFIIRKRKEIKDELVIFLKDIDHPMRADDILAEVLHDDNDEDFNDFVMFLGRDSMMEDPESAQEMAMDLFNFFPRQTLHGKSLAELMPFTELKKMEKAFQDFKNGTGDGNYSYSLPKELW